jgi:hypothetical protein
MSAQAMTRPPRKHTRVAVDLWAVERGDDFTSYHRVVNLSSEGLFFESALPMSEGTTCRLDVELPGGAVVRTLATVVHSTATARDAGIGVRLAELAPAARHALESFLESRRVPN